MDAQACLCNTYCLHSESSFSGAGRNLTAIERRCRPIIQHRGVAIQLQSSADATEGPRLSQPKKSTTWSQFGGLQQVQTIWYLPYDFDNGTVTTGSMSCLVDRTGR
jgi:hypothetical protein